MVLGNDASRLELRGLGWIIDTVNTAARIFDEVIGQTGPVLTGRTEGRARH